MAQKHLVIIGRSEIIDFPEFFITSVPAKIDTGAYRSAIHCTNITEVTKNGRPQLSFTLLGNHPSSQYSRDITTSDFSRAVIENSFGTTEERYAVSMRVKIGHKIFMTEFTLADRSTKPYPILLGRKTLNGRFLVDTGLSNIDRKTLLEKMNITLPIDLEEKDK